MISHTTVEYEYSRKWRFTLTKGVHLYLDNSFPATDEYLTFRDQTGTPRLEVQGRDYFIAKGYSWNGCSPRPLGSFGIWWLGTPDFSSTITASLFHDAGYQFLDAPNFPYTREQIDLMFLRVMQKHGFPLARVYYAAVRTFGGLDRKLTS